MLILCWIQFFQLFFFFHFTLHFGCWFRFRGDWLFNDGLLAVGIT